MKIGFIGLGIMGAPMAGHLIAGGHQAFVQTRSKVPATLIKAGATACATAAEVAAATEMIFLMVPDTSDVGKVLYMSSISPIATKDFATRIETLGCDYLDAPVSSGEVGAKAASLTNGTFRSLAQH